MRILALTFDPSLGAALNMLDDAEIVAAPDVDTVVQEYAGAAIVLIGVGRTDEGIDIAQEIHSRGVTIPALVVGEGASSSSSTVPVLVRPFSLDDLVAAINNAVLDVGAAPVEEFHSADELASVVPEPGAVVIELHPSAGQGDEGVEDQPPAAEMRTVEPSSEVEQPVVTGPPPAAPVVEAPVQASDVAAAEPAVARAAPPTAPPPVAPREHKELLRRLGIQQRTVDAQTETPHRRRGLGRRDAARDADVPEESPLLTRLRAGLAATRDIEALLEELPVVGDLEAMAHALIGEVAFAFSPEIVAVYLHEGAMFRIIASHGLSRAEQALEADESHPLFSQVIMSDEPILIAPVDLARGLVSGIGGAHTEAMMVAPLHAEGECVAALVLGRADFTDPDLDVVANLAREAAPGLAFAHALRVLRDRQL